MEIIKLSSKGQVVIPRQIREKLQMNQGSVVGIEQVNDLVVIKKVDLDLVNQIKKSLKNIKQGKIKGWKA